MTKKSKYNWKRLLYWRPVRQILHTSRLLVLPGFQGVPIFDVLLFFGRGLSKGVLSQRAAAMAYQFFLSLFPLLLAAFTLLPFLNLEHYIEPILRIIDEFLPESIVPFIQNTVTDIMANKHKGLMSIGFLSSLYVASSGFNTLMISFNHSMYAQKRRKFLIRRLIAIGMVIGVFIAVIMSFSLIMGSREVFYYLVFNGFIDSFFQFYLLKTIKWAIIIFLIYFVLASIYYITPVNKEGFKFFSAGATVATIMFILLSNGFNIYIKYFSHYNALYGSIGAIIIFLIWMYLNSYVLILGFELNSAIAEAYIEGHSKRKVNSKSDRPKISKTAINMINAKRLKIILNRSWIGKLISKNNKKQESKH